MAADLEDILDEESIEEFQGRRISALVDLKECRMRITAAGRTVLDVGEDGSPDDVVTKITLQPGEAQLALAAIAGDQLGIGLDKHIGEPDCPAYVTGTAHFKEDDEGLTCSLSGTVFERIDGAEPSRRERATIHVDRVIQLHADCKTNPTAALMEGTDSRTGLTSYVSILHDAGGGKFAELIENLPDGAYVKLEIEGAAVYGHHGISICVAESALNRAMVTTDNLDDRRQPNDGRRPISMGIPVRRHSDASGWEAARAGSMIAYGALASRLEAAAAKQLPDGTMRPQGLTAYAHGIWRTTMAQGQPRSEFVVTRIDDPAMEQERVTRRESSREPVR